MLVSDIYTFQILFLVLQLQLFVTQLFPESFFFLVEVQKHLDVSVELCFLLGFDDLLDLSVLLNFLSFIVPQDFIFFSNFVLDFKLQLSELLGLLLNVVMHSVLHFIQVLLVNLSGFPQSQAKIRLHRPLLILLLHLGLHQDLFVVEQSFFVFVPNRNVN